MVGIVAGGGGGKGGKANYLKKNIIKKLLSHSKCNKAFNLNFKCKEQIFCFLKLRKFQQH